ncbi:ATP-binding protein [Streptomyces cavernae]|uniref:ATP-binding protein n=1 Tax=Streptomyces cavernae TaxID=2259034 RepID=UPI000FEB7FE9|nr:ATP-binding protein [Streptomyces cavernae]
MTSLIKDPLLWILIAVFLAGLGAILRARKTNMALRGHNAVLQRERDTALSEQYRLVTESGQLTAGYDAALQQVRKDAEEETKTVLKSAMRTLQVLTEEQQRSIDQLQQKYGDDEHILADLMRVDHINSQASRRAQGIAVLCGGWLGRRDAIVSVFDVARSAQGRIRHFDRVNIRTQANVSVASRAVEPVTVVLAELLANATNYSAPGTPVEINIQPVPTGVCLIVDDAGLGMSQEEKDRAAALLAPTGPVDLTSLGNPPKFGFAVSGLLATRYGFRVSVDSVSPYGGVRAVILVPDSLLTTETPEPSAGAAADESTVEGSAGAQPLTPRRIPAPVAPVGRTAGGLPKRRRMTPVSAMPHPEVEDLEHSSTTTAQLGAFQRGMLRARETGTTEGPEDQ